MKYFSLFFAFTLIFIPVHAKLKINEVMTSFYGFFNKNQLENNYFEFRKEGVVEEGDYALFVIEKNHKQTGKSVILQFANFNTKCFGGKEFCTIGKVNGTENEYKLDYLSFSKYMKKVDDGDDDDDNEEKDGYSTDFIILLTKKEEEDEWEFDNINNIKLYLHPKLESYLKQNAVDAILVGNFVEADADWIHLVKGKFNLKPIEFNMEYQKSSSYCGDNKWLTKTKPSPNGDNHCDENGSEFDKS